MTYQRNIESFLEDGFDQGLPDGIEQAEVAACDDHEAKRDSRALADLAAIRPLHAAQLVDAVAQEREQPAAALAGTPVAGALGAAPGSGRLLELVVVVELVLVDAGDGLVGLDHAGLRDARLLDLGRLHHARLF